MNATIIEPLNRLHVSGGIKVSALHSAEGKLYLGLSNGDLSIMRLSTQIEHTRPEQKSLRSFRSLSEIKNLFADNEQSQMLLPEKTFKNVTGNQSPVSSISTLPLYKDNSRVVLLIASADLLQTFEWVGSHLNLIHSFDEVRSFSDYAYMELGLASENPSENSSKNTPSRSLIIGSRKKVLIYEVKQKSRNIFNFVMFKEIALKDRVRKVHPYTEHHKVIISLNNAFWSLDLLNDFELFEVPSKSPDIFKPAQVPSFSYFGLANPVPDIKFVQCTDNTSLVVRGSGTAKLIFEDHVPRMEESAINFSTMPFTVSFMYPCFLLIVHSKTLEIVDAKTGATVQTFKHSLNIMTDEATLDTALITIAAGSDVFQFSILPFQKQIDSLLSLSGIVTITKNKKDIKKDLKLSGLDMAISLVSSLKDDDRYFVDSADPTASTVKTKMLFLRDLYKEKAFAIFQNYSQFHSSIVEIGSEWLLSFLDILALFPDFLNGALQINGPAFSSTETPVESPVKAITLKDLQHDNSFLDIPSRNESSSNSSSSDLSENQQLKLFYSAVQSLIVYLTDQRRIHAVFLHSKDAVPSIDWKSVKLGVNEIYPQASKSSIRDKLDAFATAIDTTLFLCYFYTKPLMLGPLLRLPNNKCSAKIVNDCLLKNLKRNSKQSEILLSKLMDFYFGRSLHEDALKMLFELAHENKSEDSPLKVPKLSIAYLQRLSNDHLDLVFKYSKWLVKDGGTISKENARLIFMNDTYECESYDNFKVLDYFNSTLQSEELSVMYLEWLFESGIISLPSKRKSEARLATRLCLLYLKALRNLSVTEEDFYNDASYKKLYKVLEGRGDYDSWTILKNIPTDQDRFLRLAILIYKRLGEHQKSIDILYSQLNDLNGAMDYCAQVFYSPNGEEQGRELLHKLLEDLLIHFHENEEPIARLLNMQGTKMDTLRILSSLPDTFPVQKMESFLQNVIYSSEVSMVSTKTESQLYKIGCTKARHELTLLQAGSYSVADGADFCEKCDKKLGSGIIAVNDQEKIIHYGCLNKNSLNGH